MIECVSDKTRHCCKTEINGFLIQSDATKDKGGQENGVRPHDILATAYASCLNMSVRMACDKKQIPIDSVTSKVELVRQDSKTIFKYQIDFKNPLPENTKREILVMIENCPVRRTLSKPIEFQLSEDL
ncbi:MAG: OsmC family protein [Reichenbachiella sp.]|uniref:OsmC family protein n=1 Tax=Reichenbachiella sp. TaxID=2184521 RepID=UPI0029660BCD|nr:OsmC family protein [Reichenbachiella sp.]MDW3209092.1 OsmC family protein [Reichenbachiella sp.]